MQESTTDGSRRLVVIRHAKAEPTAPSDHERALAARGRADAQEAGRWLGAQGITPDGALVSDALRTRETWQALAGAAGWDVAPSWSAPLYAAGSDSAFDLIRDLDPDLRTVVVLGHNPTMAYVAELVDDGDGEPAATTELMTQGFPTCAVAVFVVPGEWSDVGPGTGTLEAFHVGQA